MKINYLVAILALAITTAACNTNKTSKDTMETSATGENSPTSTASASKDALPSFSVTDVNGNAMDLGSLKGKKVFVNLWATWCPPCRHEIPSIEKLYAANKDNAAFVMISLDDNFELAKEYAKENNMKAPVYYPAQNLPELFNVDGIPATFIFNEKGELMKKIMGSDDYDKPEYHEMLK